MMKKIFYYELRRMMYGWMFPILLVLNGGYAWYILTTDIITGIAYTAPFSVWSYCTYLGKTLPVTVTTGLLILAGYYGKRQKQADILILAAPVTAAQHLAVRTAVAGVCYLACCLVIVAEAVIFYGGFFQYYDYAAFLLPSCLLMLSCFLFPMGMGHLLAGLHQGMAYLFAGIVFASGFAVLDQGLDLFCAGYFSGRPLGLTAGQGGEPEFFIEPVWLAARCFYILSGAVLFLGMLRHCGQKQTSDRDG